MKAFLSTFKEIGRYPSAIAGLVIIGILIIISIYALVTIPYDEAVRLWRGGEDIWYANPKTAPPAWFNFFSRKKQPVTLTISSARGEAEKEVVPGSADTTDINLTYTFDYQYDDFPTELTFYFTSKFVSKQPFVAIRWITPDGRELRVADFGINARQTYRASQDEKLTRRLGRLPAEVGLFADPNSDPAKPVPLKGTYQIRIEGVVFEPDADINAEFVMQGKLAGWAGTDHQRRDLMVPLLWGTPVALAFGLVASLGTGLLTMIIAAFGVWYGGWVDELIQRITEINLVLPFLSILIMVGTFYSRSIWTILGVTILLSIFTGGIKSYRAIFMQIKETTYIEAARAYGASDMRIIFLYLIPRIIPVLIPGLISGIPAFVFLEASLAVLGLGDPVLPTWGKIINNAFTNGALYNGQYYWVLEPAALLMITGFAFAMLGFSLDRIFNPRLRGL
ncbi:MAG: ABC transporter permease [Chloroflexota bacterium]